MLLVDSHCHLDRLSYGSKQTDMADVLAKAAQQSVGYFLCVSVTQAQFPTMMEAIAPLSPGVCLLRCPPAQSGSRGGCCLAADSGGR